MGAWFGDHGRRERERSSVLRRVAARIGLGAGLRYYGGGA